MSGVQHYRVDVYRSCAKGISLEGEIPLASMPRLVEALVRDEGAARFSIRFSEEGRERYRAIGSVEAELVLTCQRCLQPAAVTVRSEIRLGFVQSEQEAELLDPSWDPQLIESAIIDVAELVEDELLLSVPAYPSHMTQAECEALGWHPWESEEDINEIASELPGERENPFAVLEKLKKH